MKMSDARGVSVVKRRAIAGAREPVQSLAWEPCPEPRTGAVSPLYRVDYESRLLRDLRGDDLVVGDADRVATALLAQPRGDLLIPESRVGSEEDLPARAGAADSREQLVDEAQRAALRVGLALAQPDVQDLVGARARGQQRVVAELAGVAVAGALLGVAVDLAEEAVDVDHEAILARAGPRPPRAAKRLAEHPIELADVPERKRTQERPERRRGHRPMSEDRLGPPRSEHVAVIDAVSAQQHRVHQREHLASRPRGARPTVKPNGRIDERLDPEPPPELDREHEPGVDDHALVIENDLGSVRQILHHEGDLLTQAAVAPNDSFLPAQEVISHPNPDGSPLPKRRIEA